MHKIKLGYIVGLKLYTPETLEGAADYFSFSVSTLLPWCYNPKT